MPDEIFIIVVTAIVAGAFLALVAMLLAFARSRAKDRLRTQGTAGPSLTTSELERLMRQAVADATAPLAAQVERLEARLEEQVGAGPLLTPLSEPGLLEELPEEEAVPARRRRRSKA